MDKLVVNAVTGGSALVPLSIEEEAEAAVRALAETNSVRRIQQVADETARGEAKADTVVQFLRDNTPADIVQYVRNQVNADGVTNLVTAQAAIKKLETLVAKLAVVASLGAKRDLRD